LEGAKNLRQQRQNSIKDINAKATAQIEKDQKIREESLANMKSLTEAVVGFLARPVVPAATSTPDPQVLAHLDTKIEAAVLKVRNDLLDAIKTLKEK
jgi:hypothetical protein